MRQRDHASSVSYADYSVDRDSVRAVVRLPLDDVDLLLKIDRDLDGRVSDAEIAAANPAIASYIGRHLRVTVDGRTLGHTIGRSTIWTDRAAVPYLETNVLLDGASLSGRLSIQSDFLVDLYPDHQTIGHVRVAGAEDQFTFRSSAAYERRIGADWATGSVAVLVAVALLGALLFARRRGKFALAAAIVFVATAAQADVIMSSSGLNATLKAMERFTREASETSVRRADALFNLGAEADALATTMNLEVESHGMQERALLDLALSRAKELGIAIAYNRDKKKFFYDGAAFGEYLRVAPHGTHAAAAEFKLLSYQFYQSPTEIAALTAAAAAKKSFLARYPKFDANAEMRLYLAVDYRDLYRHYRDQHDAANASESRKLARAECERIARLYPRSEQADAARQVLRSLGAEK